MKGQLSSPKFTAFCCFLLSYCALHMAAAAQVLEERALRGSPFTDPEARFAMPPGWESQPIEHESWAEDTDLAITLDQHLYHAFLPYIREFATEHKVNVAVKEGTCGISAGKLSDKTVDVGGFCCPPATEDRLPGLRFHTLGIGAIALIVNRELPLDNVSLAEAQALFAGQIVRWRELSLSNRSDGPRFVRPVGRLHCKKRPGHWRLLLDNEDLFSPRLLEVTTIADMLKVVATQRDAIGYEVLWMVHSNPYRERVKTLSIDNVNPSDATRLAEGAYPLYRTYNVTTWEGPIGNPLAAELVRYLEEKVESLDPAYGMVPASRLRAAGWVFAGDELVGEPR